MKLDNYNGFLGDFFSMYLIICLSDICASDCHNLAESASEQMMPGRSLSFFGMKVEG